MDGLIANLLNALNWDSLRSESENGSSGRTEARERLRSRAERRNLADSERCCVRGL